MVNSQVISEIVNALKIDIRTTPIPNAIPVIEVGTKQTKNGFSGSNSLTNGTSATIYTADSTRDTYITGATLSTVRDATAVYGLVSVKYIPFEGSTTAVNILSLGGITLTAHPLVTAVTPTMHPIKIARGSNVTLVSDSATGNFKATGQIYGFIDEVI